MTITMFVAGLALLVVGGEALVRGAARLALAVGLSPLVVGLTVVAYGTGSPEMAVSIQAGLSGSSDLALGNVVGSNVFNVLFILGASALALFELEKALYELRYELANRPDWVSIPLSDLVQAVGRTADTRGAQEASTERR